MPISFDAIPIDIRVPGQYIEIDPSAAARAEPGVPVRVLLLGQKLPFLQFQVDDPKHRKPGD